MNTGIEIKTAFFPIAWVLFFVKPVIEINDIKVKKPWGTGFFKLPAGVYIVKIHFNYLGAECGANQIRVRLFEGQTVKISYYMPPWIFAKGIMKIK